MNIGINNSEYYNGSSPRTGGANESLTSAQRDALKGELDVSSLRSAQTISGEVTSLEGDNVTIKLGNGQTINARLEGNAGISVGQLLSFEVNSKFNSNTIELRPLFSNLAANNTISTALKAAGLALSSANITMTQTMMEEGMSIDRNSLLQMARQVNAYPMADPSSIVKMDKLGMVINELNVTQYENYSNFEHQIINNVTDMADDFASVITRDCLSTGEAGANLAIELLSVIDETLISDENVLVQAQDVIDSAEQKGLLLKEAMMSGNDAPEAVINGEALKDVALREGIMPGIKGFMSELKDMLTALGRELPDTVSAGDVINAFREGIEQYKDLLNQPATLESGDNSAIYKNALFEALDKMTANDSFKDFLSDSLKSQFTLKPEMLGKEGEVERLYERIQRTSLKLLNIASDARGLNNIAQNAQNISDNVNFMNQLNQFVNYVQLPLKMAQENAHGELYVYSNKKNLASKDGNLTALLHLDMEHLGPMDVYVSMQNFENVNTHFYMESEEMLDFIADNIHILDERLTAKGYNMSSNVSMKDPGRTRPITEEFLKESPDDQVRKVAALGFDVRA